MLELLLHVAFSQIECLGVEPHALLSRSEATYAATAPAAAGTAATSKPRLRTKSLKQELPQYRRHLTTKAAKPAITDTTKAARPATSQGNKKVNLSKWL